MSETPAPSRSRRLSRPLTDDELDKALSVETILKDDLNKIIVQAKEANALRSETPAPSRNGHEAPGCAHCMSCTDPQCPARLSETGDIPEGCTPADAMALREANFKLVALFNEISAVLEMWDDGLDDQDGEDYERGVKAWDEMMVKIREYR